ncbi:MAG: hypothetical protein NWR72_11280, partial [Bacteroidia bacterium]|nr:hypothetical protein [Bacteroidia bacterium]
GYPTLLIFSPEGNLLGKSEGYLAPNTLTAILNKHLCMLDYRQDLIAMSGMTSRGNDHIAYQPTSRGFDMNAMTPPLLVGSMERFSAADATSISQADKPVLVSNMTNFGNSRSADDTPANEMALVTDASFLQTGQTSRGGAQSTGLLVDVPGLESYSLRLLDSRPAGGNEAFGLLVGNFINYEEAVTEVKRFERLWRDRIFVYCEEVEATLVYRVVLGEYEDMETAKAFSQAIYKMEKINPTIIPLHSLRR